MHLMPILQCSFEWVIAQSCCNGRHYGGKGPQAIPGSVVLWLVPNYLMTYTLCAFCGLAVGTIMAIIQSG